MADPALGIASQLELRRQRGVSRSLSGAGDVFGVRPEERSELLRARMGLAEDQAPLDDTGKASFRTMAKEMHDAGHFQGDVEGLTNQATRSGLKAMGDLYDRFQKGDLERARMAYYLSLAAGRDPNAKFDAAQYYQKVRHLEELSLQAQTARGGKSGNAVQPLDEGQVMRHTLMTLAHSKHPEFNASRRVLNSYLQGIMWNDDPKHANDKWAPEDWARNELKMRGDMLARSAKGEQLSPNNEKYLAEQEQDPAYLPFLTAISQGKIDHNAPGWMDFIKRVVSKAASGAGALGDDIQMVDTTPASQPQQ